MDRVNKGSLPAAGVRLLCSAGPQVTVAIAGGGGAGPGGRMGGAARGRGKQHHALIAWAGQTERDEVANLCRMVLTIRQAGVEASVPSCDACRIALIQSRGCLARLLHVSHVWRLARHSYLAAKPGYAKVPACRNVAPSKLGTQAAAPAAAAAEVLIRRCMEPVAMAGWYSELPAGPAAMCGEEVARYGSGRAGGEA